MEDATPTTAYELLGRHRDKMIYWNPTKRDFYVKKECFEVYPHFSEYFELCRKFNLHCDLDSMEDY